MFTISIVNAIRRCNPNNVQVVELLRRRIAISMNKNLPPNIRPNINNYYRNVPRLYDNEFIAAMTTHNYTIATEIVRFGADWLANDHSELFFTFIHSTEYLEGRGFALAAYMCLKMTENIKRNPRLTNNNPSSGPSAEAELFAAITPFFKLDASVLFSPNSQALNFCHENIMLIFPEEYGIQYTNAPDLHHEYAKCLDEFLTKLTEFGPTALSTLNQFGAQLFETHLEPVVFRLYRIHLNGPFDNEGGLGDVSVKMCEALNNNPHLLHLVWSILFDFNMRIDPKLICNPSSEESFVTTASFIPPNPPHQTNPPSIAEPIPIAEPIQMSIVEPMPIVEPIQMPTVEPISTAEQISTAEPIPTAEQMHSVQAEPELIPWFYQVSDPSERGIRLEKPPHYRNGGKYKGTGKRGKGGTGKRGKGGTGKRGKTCRHSTVSNKYARKRATKIKQRNLSKNKRIYSRTKRG